MKCHSSEKEVVHLDFSVGEDDYNRLCGGDRHPV